MLLGRSRGTRRLKFTGFTWKAGVARFYICLPGVAGKFRKRVMIRATPSEEAEKKWIEYRTKSYHSMLQVEFFPERDPRLNELTGGRLNLWVKRRQQATVKRGKQRTLSLSTIDGTINVPWTVISKYGRRTTRKEAGEGHIAPRLHSHPVATCPSARPSAESS